MNRQSAAGSTRLHVNKQLSFPVISKQTVLRARAQTLGFAYSPPPVEKTKTAGRKKLESSLVKVRIPPSPAGFPSLTAVDAMIRKSRAIGMGITPESLVEAKRRKDARDVNATQSSGQTRAQSAELRLSQSGGVDFLNRSAKLLNFFYCGRSIEYALRRSRPATSLGIDFSAPLHKWVTVDYDKPPQAPPHSLSPSKQRNVNRIR
jgi:hypothetical protein